MQAAPPRAAGWQRLFLYQEPTDSERLFQPDAPHAIARHRLEAQPRATGEDLAEAARAGWRGGAPPLTGHGRPLCSRRWSAARPRSDGDRTRLPTRLFCFRSPVAQPRFTRIGSLRAQWLCCSLSYSEPASDHACMRCTHTTCPAVLRFFAAGSVSWSPSHIHPFILQCWIRGSCRFMRTAMIPSSTPHLAPLPGNALGG